MFHNLPIMRDAWIAVETCMKIKPEENVLVVTDARKTEIAVAFAYAAKAVGTNT